MQNYKEKIITIVLKHFPSAEAIYLFGSYKTEFETNDSDIDIAILFPIKKTDSFNSQNLKCVFDIQKEFDRSVDLLDLRNVSTVFQKEIIEADKCLFCSNEFSKDEFEMLTISYYQKLNEERKEILEEFYKTKRAYSV